MNWLATLRANIWAFLVAAGAALYGFLRYYMAKAAREKERRMQAEKTILYKEHVDEADEEIEQEYSHRAIEANKDRTKVPENLKNSNDW